MNLEHMGYVGYSHALGVEDDTVNEWAPFSTRMEWELARWAKTRGPSSTALSELLKIDGVSQLLPSDQICHNSLTDCFGGILWTKLPFSDNDQGFWVLPPHLIPPHPGSPYFTPFHPSIAWYQSEIGWKGVRLSEVG